MKKYLVNRLAKVYKMHEYDTPPERMKYLIVCMDKSFSIDKCTEKEIDEFVDKVESGFFGILYRQPTCITNMWTKFTENKPKSVTYKVRPSNSAMFGLPNDLLERIMSGEITEEEATEIVLERRR